jgi:hydrogenase nickel incorporation protein HypA/HybF
MHELAITENVVEISLSKAKEAYAKRISGINLIIGELSGFAPECIQLYFDALSRNTIAQGAALNFESAPVRLRCRNCTAVFRLQANEWTCPECHSPGAEIIAGRELYIKSLEVE